ncbi:MAG: carboxymuconolactone decarboxylase family protein [Terriglobia bacterium]
MKDKTDGEDAQIDPMGRRMYEEVLQKSVQEGGNAPSLVGVREFTLNHLFAKVWSRSLDVSDEKPGLTLKERRLITIALLAAQGRNDQLKEHIRGACRAGIPKEVLLELMLHLAHYAGWPAGASGQATVQSVYQGENSS